MQVAQLQQEAYRSGEVGFENVPSTQMALLGARLELAETAETRIKVRHQMLEAARQIEETTGHLFKARETSRADFLKAKALRQRAEADLALEQQASS